jgi:hypothetical protein
MSVNAPKSAMRRTMPLTVCRPGTDYIFPCALQSPDREAPGGGLPHPAAGFIDFKGFYQQFLADEFIEVFHISIR